MTDIRLTTEGSFAVGISQVLCFVTILTQMTLFSRIPRASGQYRDYTPQYKLLMRQNMENLSQYLETNPYFDPANLNPLIDIDTYRFEYPNPTHYRIGIIVDPCRNLTYDCCVNVFGTPIYQALKRDGLEAERAIRRLTLANSSDIRINSNLVYEDGLPAPSNAYRNADDEDVLDFECEAINVPYSRCRGKNYAQRTSTLKPPCSDNNQTLNTLEGCYDLDGKYHKYCVQVGYTQNAYLAVCGGEFADSDHCGTFLEIHQLQGSPYYPDENTLIAETKLKVHNVSGYYTTTLPMTYMRNNSRILCTYVEPFLRVGSIVYIKNTAPVCCCPKPFKAVTRVGSIECPQGPNGNGRYAGFFKTTSDEINYDTILKKYPYCPYGLEEDDKIWCSVHDQHDWRHFTRECDHVNKTTDAIKSHTSIDLDGKEYDGYCPYHPNCALTLDAGKCQKEDLRYTFIGQTGRVTAYNKMKLPVPTVNVTFNDGRTSYEFIVNNVQLEPKSMYEIWWVKRTRSEFVVQKRKGFNISYPQCTYDTTNDRYFPFTMLDANGVPIVASDIT